MNKEDKKHLEFMDEMERQTTKAFNNLVPYMANNYNPEYVQAVKGTPLENLTADDREELERVINKAHINRYRAFKEGWKNVFGDTNVLPFKDSPAKILDEYMESVLRAKRESFAPNYAEDWLKARYAQEIIKGRTKK